ncbi:hypothetical protein [Frigoriglobus tundricola]|uniref:SMI1/KNR4 family protein n=1 Tax=Frigoriglobus tundricola TaxID=2774151 RepID=A0A6M5YRV5_9BACT|nr:hypothetical protein [Frigoriglobus tundricola]QJW96785.1 hypothetical protein FTUN_4344 [Frigoriglobus tundricola]
MTEAEWLECEEPDPMLEFLSDKASECQLRLTICACYRQWWVHKSLLPPDPLTQLLREAVDHVERSRGALPPDHVRYALRDEIRDRSHSSVLHLEQWELKHLGIYILMANETINGTIFELRICRDLAAKSATRRRDGAAYDAAAKAELPEQAAIIRDIFGNPFRPLGFAPSWRTDTAVALARQIYDTRDFSAMPILADALQDAGCDSDDTLGHLRDPHATHARGCWALDLVLGKE